MPLFGTFRRSMRSITIDMEYPHVHKWEEVREWKEVRLFRMTLYHVILRCEKCGDLKEFTY